MAQENTGILLLSKRLHPLQIPLDLNSSQSARLVFSYIEYSSDIQTVLSNIDNFVFYTWKSWIWVISSEIVNCNPYLLPGLP